MAKTHHYKSKEQISQDSAGTVYRATDASSGKKVTLRKYTHLATQRPVLHAVEEVAYKVAISRLAPIRHPSLRRVISGETDPDEGIPYLATRAIEADPLQSILRETTLSVDVATTMLSQLLELCDLLSHVLAEEGIWVETDVDSIAVTGDIYNPRFIFWASPLKCLATGKKARDFDSLVHLTEHVTGWHDQQIDEREGSHLFAWLQWLKEEALHSGTTIREIREMLSAAAGIEPPPPIDSLVAESQRRLNWLEKLPKLHINKWVRAPKMPLFVTLTVMLIIQSIGGWIWVRKINSDFDQELKRRLDNIDLSIPDRPYSNDPNRSEDIRTEPTSFE